MKDIVRAGLAAAAMCAAALLAVAMEPRTFLADSAPRAKLAQIVPAQFGAWSIDTSIVPLPPSPDLQRVLDETYDETLARTYRHADGRRVMLSLAYGRNQHKGMNTHRPEICYPGQGFRIVRDTERGTVMSAGRAVPVQRLVTAMGARNEPITYWLMVGDRITEFGYAQRWATIQYGLRGQVPDGVLVRVSSIDNDNVAAFLLHERFIQDLLQSLQPAQRARLLGSSPSDA
jgi:EpsI family protein